MYFQNFIFERVKVPAHSRLKVSGSDEGLWSGTVPGGFSALSFKRKIISISLIIIQIYSQDPGLNTTPQAQNRSCIRDLKVTELDAGYSTWV